MGNDFVAMMKKVILFVCHTTDWLYQEMQPLSPVIANEVAHETNNNIDLEKAPAINETHQTSYCRVRQSSFCHTSSAHAFALNMCFKRPTSS